MEYYKLLRQPETEKAYKEYYCDDQGNIYSKLLSTGEMRLVKPTKCFNGYLVITISNKNFYVHRLVWESIKEPIPENMTLDHVNGVKTDNRFCNLQLLSRGDNAKKANDVPIDMLDLDGNFIQSFPSQMDAMRWLRSNGFPRAVHSNICSTCKGNYKFAYKHRWRYHTNG